MTDEAKTVDVLLDFEKKLILFEPSRHPTIGQIVRGIARVFRAENIRETLPLTMSGSETFGALRDEWAFSPACVDSVRGGWTRYANWDPERSDEGPPVVLERKDETYD